MAKAPKKTQTTATVNVKAEATLRNRIARLERHVKAFPADVAAVAALTKAKGLTLADASRRAEYKGSKVAVNRVHAMFARRIKAMNNIFKFHQKEEGLVIGGKFLNKAAIVAFGK